MLVQVFEKHLLAYTLEAHIYHWQYGLLTENDYASKYENAVGKIC